MDILISAYICKIFINLIECDDVKLNLTLFFLCCFSFGFGWIVFTCWMTNGQLSTIYWTFVIGFWSPYLICSFWQNTCNLTIPIFLYCYVLYWEPINPIIEWIALSYQNITGDVRVPYFLYTFEEEKKEIEETLLPWLYDYKKYIVGTLIVQQHENRVDLEYYGAYFKHNSPYIKKLERKILILEDALKRQLEFCQNIEDFANNVLERKRPVHALKVFGAENQIAREWPKRKFLFKRCSIEYYAKRPGFFSLRWSWPWNW